MHRLKTMPRQQKPILTMKRMPVMMQKKPNKKESMKMAKTISLQSWPRLSVASQSQLGDCKV